MTTTALLSSRQALALAAPMALIAASAACARNVEPDVPSIADSSEALSELAWTPPAPIGSLAGYGVASTTLGTTTYVTYTIPRLSGPAIRLTQSTGNNTWTTPTDVSVGRPGAMSLAALGGSLYLITLQQAPKAIVLSRFDLSTRIWLGNAALPFPIRASATTPGSLAVDHGILYLVGEAATNDGSAAIFLTSMTPSGTFGPAQTLPLQGSSPSIASYNGALHIVATSGGQLWHLTTDSAGWTAPEVIALGVEAGNAYLARYAKPDGSIDCLHVVNVPPIRTLDPSSVSWTYTCSSTPGFADAVTIPGSATLSGLMGIAADTNHLVIGYNGQNASVQTQSFSY